MCNENNQNIPDAPRHICAHCFAETGMRFYKYLWYGGWRCVVCDTLQ